MRATVVSIDVVDEGIDRLRVIQSTADHLDHNVIALCFEINRWLMQDYSRVVEIIDIAGYAAFVVKFVTFACSLIAVCRSSIPCSGKTFHATSLQGVVIEL